MAKSTQKTWTRNMVLSRLQSIEEAYQDIQKFADNGGRMPSVLRKKLDSTVANIGKTREAFKNWQV